MALTGEKIIATTCEKLGFKKNQSRDVIEQCWIS
jgi:hypothetical protein